MKRYKSLISALSLFLSAALFSCSQEESSLDTFREEGAPLTLHVTSGQYASADGSSTRVAEEAYITRFTSGDQIGVLQVITPSNGEKQYNAYCFTLDDKGNWTSEETLLHQSGHVTYVAYYPYVEIADAEALDAYIAGFVPRQNQLTYADYTNSDLMKGEGIVSGTTLNVTLQHLMSLLIMEVPMGKCSTTKDGKVKYHSGVTTYAPPAITWEEGKIPYQTVNDDKVFRYLTKPATDMTLKGSYLYYSGTQKFEVNAGNEELSAAKYRLWKIDEGVTPPATREVKVGDYYMNDGTIVPGDASIVPEGCIGIVFQTDAARMSPAEIAEGWTHGYVMALTNAGKDSKWGQGSTEGAIPESPFATRINTFKGMYEDIEGYQKTHYMLDAHEGDVSFQDVNGAFYQTQQYGESIETAQFKAPQSTSGWYLPSIGQWWDILDNLGKAKGLNGLKGDESASTNLMFDLSGETVLANLNACLAAASSDADAFEASNSSKSIIYWSSSEHNRVNSGKLSYAHSVYLENSSIKSTGATKTSNSNRRVRCVLSF